MINTVKYDLIEAYKQQGDKIHPLEEMKSLGIIVISYEGFPTSECIIMRVGELPAKIPDYVTKIEDK